MIIKIDWLSFYKQKLLFRMKRAKLLGKRKNMPSNKYEKTGKKPVYVWIMEIAPIKIMNNMLTFQEKYLALWQK